MQDIFEFERIGISPRGKVVGRFVGCGRYNRSALTGCAASESIFRSLFSTR